MYFHMDIFSCPLESTYTDIHFCTNKFYLIKQNNIHKLGYWIKLHDFWNIFSDLLPILDVKKQTCFAVLGMPSSKIYRQFCFLVIYFLHVHIHTK
jgi:hypothetical protein